MVYSAQLAPDHGFIITGSLSWPLSSTNTAYVIKIDEAGNFEWSRYFNLANQAVEAFSVRPISSGGYILTGRTVSIQPYLNHPFALRINNAGTLIWAKEYTGLSSGGGELWDMIPTSTGYLGLLFQVSTGLAILRTDTSGNPVSAWQSNIYTNHMWNYMMAGSKFRTLSDGGYCFVSCGGGYDDKMIRLDSNGNFLWGKELRLITADVTETPDHGFMVVGNGPIMGVALANTDNPQIGVVKMDSAGGATDCYNDPWITTEPVTFGATPVTFIQTPGPGLIRSRPAVNNTILSYWEGCVTITGDIPEKAVAPTRLVISPNPTTGSFTIETDINKEMPVESIRLTDASGRIVFTVSGKLALPYHIENKGLQAGVFFLTVNTEGKVMVTKLMVK